jgi:hypothetical protein
LSTAAVHGAIAPAEPTEDVFPIVHTLYDYYERF